jgi:hypothetical protein
MARTTFSGPVASDNGFIGDVTGSVTGAVYVADFIDMPIITTGALPVAAAGNAGQVRLISDNGAGNNEYCLVISTGAAWVTATGAALT